MSYEVRVHPEAVRKLERLPAKTRERVKSRLLDLSKEFGKPDTKLNIRRLRSEKDLFRLRVGDYRVVFEFAEDILWVARISHRREAYRGL